MTPARGGTGARRRPRSLLPGIKRLLLVVIAVFALLLAGAATAEAHHTNVGIDSVSCTGQVAFTVEAWDGGASGPGRTIPRVDVTYSVNGGKYAPLPNSPFALSGDNGYRAEASFQLPAPLPKTLQLMASPSAPWGDGAPADGSQARESVVRPVPICPVTPKALVKPVPRVVPAYRRFLPWLFAAAVAIAASRLLMNMRRRLPPDAGLRARLTSLILVPAGQTWLAVTSALVGVVSGVALALLLLKV